MENNRMIQHLNECADACDKCFNACLNEKEVSIMTRCIELSRECSEICRITASVISRDSENMDKFLKLSTEISKACAEECEKHDETHCKECAKICRQHLEASADFHLADYIL